MFRPLVPATVLLIIATFALGSCKKGQEAAEDTKAVTCDDGWAAFSKLYMAHEVPLIARKSNGPENYRETLVAKGLERIKVGWMQECGEQPPEFAACLVDATKMGDATKCGEISKYITTEKK